MLDRQTGRLEWVANWAAPPSSGPALSEEYAFVALVTGRIEGYKLDDPDGATVVLPIARVARSCGRRPPATS